MRRTLVGLSTGAGAFIGAILVAFAAGPAYAIESAGIGAVPANPRASNSRTQSIFVFESSGGKKLNDAIKIVNNTSQQKTIRVYPVDSQHSSDGAFACAQEADERKSVGSCLNQR